MASSLRSWLSSLPPSRLAEVLRHRPDATTPPPRGLDELAVRLGAQTAVADQLRQLTRPAVQVLAALARLGPDRTRPAALARALGRPATDPALQRVLDELSTRALVWPGGDRLCLPAPVVAMLPLAQAAVGFEPDPPVLPLRPAEPAAVAGQAAAAAAIALDEADAVLDVVARSPAALRQTGDVGTRELRRIARASGLPEPAVAWWLEVGAAAGLLTRHEGDVVATDRYDEWRDADPARRLAALAGTWPDLRTGRVDGRSALGGDPAGRLAVDVRRTLLRILAGLPSEHGVTDPADLAAAVSWHAPVTTMPLAQPELVTDALWRQACALGVVACGTLTPLGHALAHADPGALVSAARAIVPGATASAVVQADLTAVVPGWPTGELRDLLDACADRESRGGAGVWRFSAGSVRRALDAGYDPDDLLRRVTAAAGGGVPQALAYLVRDVARRHGAVRVRAVGCVLHSTDPTLVAELVRAPGLTGLGLAALAPTVLTGARPVAETLAALRAAGYAPVGEDACGALLVERPPLRRAPTRVPTTVPATPAPAQDPLALAEALLAAPPPPPAAPPPRNPVGTRLTPAEEQLIVDTATLGGALWIRYTDVRGRTTERVVEPLELDGRLLVAWCLLRDAERVFSLDRIAAVAPA